MDTKLLNEVVKESGMKYAYIADQVGLPYTTLYSKLTGRSRWYIDEVYKLCKVLRLSKKQRDSIFFTEM